MKSTPTARFTAKSAKSCERVSKPVLWHPLQAALKGLRIYFDTVSSSRNHGKKGTEQTLEDHPTAILPKNKD